jgi:hypothetical protein
MFEEIFFPVSRPSDPPSGSELNSIPMPRSLVLRLQFMLSHHLCLATACALKPAAPSIVAVIAEVVRLVYLAVAHRLAQIRIKPALDTL